MVNAGDCVGKVHALTRGDLLYMRIAGGTKRLEDRGKRNTLLLSWNYNSGFNVHSKHRIHGSNGEAVEKIARYISRAAISVERVEFNSEDNTVIVYEKQKRSSSGKKATYSVLEIYDSGSRAYSLTIRNSDFLL